MAERAIALWCWVRISVNSDPEGKLVKPNSPLIVFVGEDVDNLHLNYMDLYELKIKIRKRERKQQLLPFWF